MKRRCLRRGQVGFTVKAPAFESPEVSFTVKASPRLCPRKGAMMAPPPDAIPATARPIQHLDTEDATVMDIRIVYCET